MTYEVFTAWLNRLQEIDDDDRYGLLEAYQMVKDISPIQFGKYSKKFWELNKPREIVYQMFTFTTDPAHKDLKAQEEYIISILKRKENLQIHSLYYVKEHFDTNPHFHVVIGSTRSIPPDAFKTYKKYGFVQKSKKSSLNDNGLQDYLEKENKPIILL